MLRRRLSAGALALVMSSPAQTYQTDFHFGMTYWLGMQAGFTPEESLLLASGDEWDDAGMYDARPVVAYSICIKKDPTAFKAMREHHFRATEEYPSPPGARLVAPGTPYATEAVRALIARSWTAGQTRNALVDFGGALHGFQDTYSHRGESQVPLRCDANLTWTHPRTRNGDTTPWPNYLSTNADLTHLWPEDCVKAAQETYGYLQTFAGKLFPQRKKAPAWNGAMATKVDWLHSHGVPQEQAIAQSTTLDDGGGSFKYEFGRSVKLEGFTATKGAGSDGGRRLAADMEALAKRVEKSEITPEERTLLEQYLRVLVNSSADDLPEQLALPLARTGRLPADDPMLRTTQRLRFLDRGRSAHNPMPVADLSIPGVDIATGPGRPSAWQSMYVTPLLQTVERPYVLGTDDNYLVAFALLRHAPNEVLRVAILRDGKQPRLVGVDILAMH